MSYEELRLVRLRSGLFMSSSVEDFIFRPRMFPLNASNPKLLITLMRLLLSKNCCTEGLSLYLPLARCFPK